ncbi:MAG: protein kinase [Anaerolineales bacterium]|nr:protein kinase [Anaerolineales bacterium]
MPADLLAHTLFGQYRLEAFAALTPQGELYRAWDLQNSRHLALTLLPPQITGNPETFRQLDSRASVLKKLRHAGLLSFAGLAHDEARLALLEAWCDGPTLRDVLLSNPGQPLGVPEMLTYAKALAATLDYLHLQGFVHTGLCPERVHIDREGRIFLGGLGLSKRNGEIDFQPILHPYAAPEQVHPARLSPAADIYALAALLFELLTGQPPADELTSPRKLNPSIPDYLARLILQGLAKRPTERFNSAGEFFLTLCMGAGLPAESIPERAGQERAPVTAHLLHTWHYLPPPVEVVSAPIPLRPLEKVGTQSAVATRPKTDFSRFLRPALILLLLAGIGLALWQIEPATPSAPVPAQSVATATSALSGLIQATPAPTLTPLPAPTEAHGGNIVFTCTRGDFNQICMVRADGQNLQLLTNTTFAHNYYPAFAPGGEEIVFASNRGGTFDLYRLVLKTGELTQLTNRIGNVLSPSYSPDGQKIVFVNRVGEGPSTIWIINRDGLNPRQIYPAPNNVVAAAWSPDGNTIAYAMSVDQPKEFEIFLMNPDGTNHRRISRGLLGIGGSLAWSPDARYLLIFAGPPGDKDIYRLEVSNGNFLRLTTGGNNTAASYSPDGTQIVFNSLRNDGQADLYIMKADGSDLRQLTSHPEPDWQPRWEK